MGNEGAASSESPPRRRSRLRVWLVQGTAAVVLLFAFEVVRAGLFWGEDRWHAELVFADYDCSIGSICRIKPHTRRKTWAGAGSAYSYSTNAAGFRSPEFPPVARTPGIARVAVFGSSPVFGLGVSDGETLPERLREALEAARPGRRVEVLNFGLPMTYLGSAARAYSEFARAYRPDVVVFVQPEAQLLRDMNYRVLQIHQSRVLRWLLGQRWGRGIVNNFQYAAIGLGDRITGEGAGQLLRQRLAPLVEDQRATGTDVVFFHLFDGRGGAQALERAIPDGLRRTVVPGGWSHEEYLQSPLIIPADGHPNAAGQQHFAARLATVVAPLLDARGM
nr:hypothetical protein Hi04_10k_c2877_00011 [uncultured bacterium]